jgi:hypothetical protein
VYAHNLQPLRAAGVLAVCFCNAQTADRPAALLLLLQVPVGTRVRLLMRDDKFNQQQQQAEFAAVSERLPAADSSLGILNYCCVALPADEQGDAAARFLPQVSGAGLHSCPRVLLGWTVDALGTTVNNTYACPQ